MVLVLTIQVTNRREAALLPATVATVFFLLPAYGSMTPRPQLLSFWGRGAMSRPQLLTMALLAVSLAAWLQRPIETSGHGGGWCR